MTDQLHLPIRDDIGVVLITHADSDAGERRARLLLANGCRVVVTARHGAKLARILLGQSADRIVALAADIDDPAQLAKVLQRARARLGAVTSIVDGRTGAFIPRATPRVLPLVS